MKGSRSKRPGAKPPADNQLNPKTMLMPGDLDRIERKLKQMDMSFEQFMERVDKTLDDRMEIEEDLKLLLILLKGNKEIDQDDSGLIGAFKKLVTRVEKLEKLKDGAIKWIAGFSFGSGALIAYLINKLLSK